MDEAKKNSVLIVDDENLNIAALSHILSPIYTVYAAKNGQNAIKAAEKHLPDIILLDIIMPVMNGYAVIYALKSSEKTRDIPVMFITGLGNIDDEEKGLALGAADYIYKPFSPAIVKLRVRNQIEMLNQLRMIEQLTTRDQLTKIYNRRGFDKLISVEWLRAIRENTMISTLMIDIDDFKIYNDTYGHQQGDVALQTVAQIVTQSLARPGDIVARWGGEEFVALLPNTDFAGALNVAERILGKIRNTVVLCSDGTETKVRVSIGLNTQAPEVDSSLEMFITEADKALYRAKKSGKSRVLYPDDLK